MGFELHQALNCEKIEEEETILSEIVVNQKHITYSRWYAYEDTQWTLQNRIVQAAVVQWVDNFILRINRYPKDKIH